MWRAFDSVEPSKVGQVRGIRSCAASKNPFLKHDRIGAASDPISKTCPGNEYEARSRLMAARFEFRSASFPQKRDDIREVLRSQTFLETFRHQGKAGARQRFEVGAKNRFFGIL